MPRMTKSCEKPISGTEVRHKVLSPGLEERVKQVETEKLCSSSSSAIWRSNAGLMSGSLIGVECCSGLAKDGVDCADMKSH